MARTSRRVGSPRASQSTPAAEANPPQANPTEANPTEATPTETNQNSKREKVNGPRPSKLTIKRRKLDPPVTNVVNETWSSTPAVLEAERINFEEPDGVVPEAERIDVDGDNQHEVEDDIDRVVPPVQEIDDDMLEEEEYLQFGVGDEVADNAGENVDGDEAADNDDENVDGDEDIDADFRDEDEIPEPLENSDDEEDGNPNPNPNGGVPDGEYGDLLRLGKCFATTEDFRIAILRYSLRSRYDVKLYRSEALRIGARCNDRDRKCGWRVYASYNKRKQKMQITVFSEVHTCVRSGYTNVLKQSGIQWLFKDRLRDNPKLTKVEMAEEILREYNLVVSEEKCSKAKTYLAKLRKQSHESHFAKIWDYQAEVLQSNPDSTFEIETVPGAKIGSKQRFLRSYMCFKAQKDSWINTCRPILGMDGAFLKWDIKGHLLAAVGRDGENRIVPIAWAIVEIESDDNWLWFVRLLSMDLDLGDGRKVAVISDKQKGLIKAVHTLLPRAEHRQCARHIFDNWKKDSHDMELQRLFWKIARSYNSGEFSANMDALMRYSPKCYETLLRTTPATWSRAFFRVGSCCNDILNNLCESFNRTIRAARRKPILELLEDVRRQCMVRTEKRSVAAERLETRFTKKAHEEIERMVAGSRACTRHRARNDLHEVEVGGIGFLVNMNDKTCGCMKWQLTGIPCVHAAAVIIGKKKKVEDYVSNFYTTETLRNTYKDGIKPVQGELMWPRMNKLPVLPPPWRLGNPGRPRNYARKKGVNEASKPSSRLNREGRGITCSNCQQEGHNKLTCKNRKVNAPPKRPRGRPNKGQPGDSTRTSQGQASQSGASAGTSQFQASQTGASQVQDGGMAALIRSVFD